MTRQKSPTQRGRSNLHCSSIPRNKRQLRIIKPRSSWFTTKWNANRWTGLLFKDNVTTMLVSNSLSLWATRYLCVLYDSLLFSQPIQNFKLLFCMRHVAIVISIISFLCSLPEIQFSFSSVLFSTQSFQMTRYRVVKIHNRLSGGGLPTASL